MKWVGHKTEEENDETGGGDKEQDEQLRMGHFADERLTSSYQPSNAKSQRDVETPNMLSAADDARRAEDDTRVVGEALKRVHGVLNHRHAYESLSQRVIQLIAHGRCFYAVSMIRTPRALTVKLLRMAAAILWGEIREDELERSLPNSAPLVLCETETFLQSGGALDKLPDEPLLITLLVLKSLESMFDGYEPSEMDGVYWEAISILEREVHERSEGGTRPLRCRDAMVLLGVDRRVEGVGQA